MLENIKNKEKKFEVKSNKNNLFYIHFLNKGDTLLISTYYKNEISKFDYETEFDLLYIKKVKLFTIYDTLDECLDEIFAGINTGKSSIIEDNNFINLNIPLKNIKFKEIIFKVAQKKKSDKDKIEELYEIIKEQKLEIINLKSKIDNLEKDMKELLNLKKELEEKKEKEKEKEIIKIDSNIINNNYDYKLYLKNWIAPDRGIKTQLLYRLSRDGDSVQTFHNLCDNISPTLVLTESLNGNKFGGYTVCQWDQSGSNKNEGNTFLFSLTKNKIFKKKDINQREICCNREYGPIFGLNDFYFYPTLKKCNSTSTYYFLNNNDLADNENNQFEVKEVEIYKCLFE